MSMIEVLAAMSVFAVVTVGVVPLILSGLRSTVTAKNETVAKNLGQERLELMRNLPYYVGSSTANPAGACFNNPARTSPRGASGLAECDYKDVLDTYFRSTYPAPSPSAGGYVAANNGRSSDEADAGLNAPFYRFVVDPVPDFPEGRFTQSIATQFLNADRLVVTPPASYNSQDSDTDLPPSRLLGVTVTTKWSAGTSTRKFTLFSQIADGQIRESGGLNEPTTVAVQAQATALRVRSSVVPAAGLTAEAGTSRSDGSLFNAARASAFAQGAFAELAPGTRADGRFQAASTPPESTPEAAGSTSGFSLPGPSPASFTAVRFGETAVSGVTAGVETGLPAVPRTAPGTNLSTGRLAGGGAGVFEFTNGAAGTHTGVVEQHPSLPLLFSGAAGTGDFASGSTFVRAVAGTAHFAESGARAGTGEIRILPTVFAPDGIVQVQLVSASLNCKTTGSLATGTTGDFDVRIKYFSNGVYISLPAVRPGGLPLPDPNLLVVRTAPPLTLGSYISSWTALTAATFNLVPASALSASLPGVVQITTANTRAGDPASAIRIEVGVLACISEDRR
ncbi:MAG: hypothetical protein ACRDIU_08445 [Actinomycetota bacterium]